MNVGSECKLYSYSFSQHIILFVQDFKDYENSREYNDMFENDEDDNWRWVRLGGARTHARPTHTHTANMLYVLATIILHHVLRLTIENNFVLDWTQFCTAHILRLWLFESDMIHHKYLLINKYYFAQIWKLSRVLYKNCSSVIISVGGLYNLVTYSPC